MTRIPDHCWEKAVKALKKEGFKVERDTRNHVKLWKDGLTRTVVVPKYDSLPPFIVSNILRTAKVSRKRYADLVRGGRRGKSKTKT